VSEIHCSFITNHPAEFYGKYFINFLRYFAREYAVKILNLLKRNIQTFESNWSNALNNIVMTPIIQCGADERT